MVIEITQAIKDFAEAMAIRPEDAAAQIEITASGRRNRLEQYGLFLQLSDLPGFSARLLEIQRVLADTFGTSEG